MVRCIDCNKLIGQSAHVSGHTALRVSAKVSNKVTGKLDAEYFDCKNCGRRVIKIAGGNWSAYEDYAN